MEDNLRILEWENFEFPLKLSNIITHNGIYRFRKETTLIIERDVEFKLKGTIIGKSETESDLNNQSINPNNKDVFPKSESITCYCKDGYKYEINECLIFIKKIN